MSAQEQDSVVSEGEEPEYRIYVSSKGNEAVMHSIRGEEALELDIRYIASLYPHDTIYIREVVETVVRVIEPG